MHAITGLGVNDELWILLLSHRVSGHEPILIVVDKPARIISARLVSRDHMPIFYTGYLLDNYGM